MFDPVDRKRPLPRRSLLDFASGEGEASPLRGSNETLRRRPQTAASLLDRLPTASSSNAADTGYTPPDIPSTEQAARKRPGLGGWLRGRAASGKALLSEKPAAAGGPVAGYASAFDADGDDRRSGDRPLIDVTTILAAVWQVRMLIIVATVIGAVGGVLLALWTPSIYSAESKLYVDPREIRLTDSDLSKQSLATEAILALVDSQLEVLRSRTVLEKVASDLGLDRDPEFGGDAASVGGLSGGFRLIRDLLSGGRREPAPQSGVDARTLESLSEAVTVSRDPKTFIVTIEVQSRDPAKSALIANRIVTTFLDEETAAQSAFFQRTTAALDNRLADLRTQLDAAETAVEKYKGDNDIIGASGELIYDKQLLAINDQVGAVRSRIADARAKSDVANRIQLNDVLSGAFPEEIASTTLAELRKQYSEARARLGSLEASLGPRHPQRLAAVQSLDVARDEIGNELRRIVATTDTELQRAIRTEKDLVQQLATQKARQVNSSQGFVELRELERKAAATRSIYESFLKRASETGQEEKLTSGNIRVVSSAEPPLNAQGPSRKLIAIGGMLAGLMGGIGLGVLLGMYRSVKDTMGFVRRRNAGVPDGEPPHDDGAPAGGYRASPTGDAARWAPPVIRSAVPSAHHAEAASAARNVYPQHVREDDPAPQDPDDLTRVTNDLRALRTRVEHYTRHADRPRRSY